MIDVGMGQHDGVDALGQDGERVPVALPVFLEALEHPAVDEDSGVVGRDQESAPGDRAGGPEEPEVGRHEGLSTTTGHSA